MTKAPYGQYYTDLYKLGWFNSPQVCKVLKVAFDQEPHERQRQIKEKLYAELGTDSLAKVNPQHFVRTLDGMGLFFTLPTSLKDQLR
ncbi:hypothetical protein NIZ92_11590 [Alcaligenes sp. 1735tsa3]|uniref:hypothetical protein n=1 Tax=Alcaligenes sp. 1735tsa3 TaxID=2953809 RepID=UPI0020A81837|nr:hypothetical protein [Alcaligenes sp. 1735tsa3]USY23965.1 hypothetical protein NIZ92_11590 [Alcaligenes sp. 1735tsa3]